MRVLVVGAGALGGYFGGCLVKAGRDVTVAELRAIGAAAGFAARSKFIGEEMAFLTDVASEAKASMLRDIERRGPTEGEHMLGQLVALARKHGVATPTLDLAHYHVAAYEVVRSRK
jgi:2-dehydropantoate 2-reductase